MYRLRSSDYNPNEHWIRLLFKPLYISVIPLMFPELILAMAVGLLAAHLEHRGVVPTAPSSGFSLISTPLAFLLVFRTNISWSRYWQGRKVMADMTVCMRQLVRQVLAYLDGDDAGGRQLRLQAALQATALHRLLCRSVADTRLGQEDEEQEQTVLLSSLRLSRTLQKAAAARRLTNQMQRHLERNLDSLLASWSDATQLASVPIPYPYLHILSLLIVIFVYTVPFSFAADYGWVSPLVSGLVALAYLGISRSAADIENPFDKGAMDVDALVYAERGVQETALLLDARDPGAGPAFRTEAEAAAALVEPKEPSLRSTRPDSPAVHDR